MLLAALILAASLAQPEPAKTTGRYTVLKASGDLDNDRFCQSIATELDAIKDSVLIIIELDGNRARPDLVARLGAKLKSNPTPVSILLKDAVDKKVGIGQLLLGFYAKSCFIDPATDIAAASNDDLKSLAPPSTSWEPIERDISGIAWTRLGERSADQALARALTAPHEDWFVVPDLDKHPWRLSQTLPAGGQSGAQPHQIIWAAASGLDRITIKADTAVGLALCANKVQNLTPVLADANLSIRSTRSNKSVSNGLGDASASVSRILEDSKLAARKVVTTLTVKSNPNRPTPAEEYRKASKAALTQIEKASLDLDRAEALLSDYPEIDRRASTNPKKPALKAAIEAIRKDLEKHRVIARDFGTR